MACFCCCVVYVFVVCEFGVKRSPSIFRFMFTGSVVLFICSASCVLYAAGSGVKRVPVVLSGLKMRSFVCVHVCISVGMIECFLFLCLCRCVLML